jgi:hypothetical protein
MRLIAGKRDAGPDSEQNGSQRQRLPVIFPATCAAYLGRANVTDL